METYNAVKIGWEKFSRNVVQKGADYLEISEG